MKLVFKMTRLCNFSCPYCYLKSSDMAGKLLPSSDYINMDVCRKACDFALKTYEDEPIYISFFGGEPLLARDLISTWLSYVNSCRLSKKINHSITTNGSLLDGETIHVLLSNDVDIHLSTDDINERSYIDDLVAFLVASMSKKALRVFSVRVTVTRGDSDLCGYYEKLSGLGVRNIHIVPVTARSFDYESFLTRYKTLFEIVRKEALQNRSIRNAQIKFILRALSFNEVKKKFCQIGEKYLAVNTDGLLFPCTGFLDLQNYCIGDIFSSTSEEIIQRLSAFEDEILVTKKIPCQRCWMKHICAGNCSHAAFLYSGRHCGVYEEECAFMKCLGDFSVGLYKEIFNSDVALMNDIIQDTSFMDEKFRVADDVHMGGGYMYKADMNGHRVFDIDERQARMLLLMNGERSNNEIYHLITEQYGHLEKDEYISTLFKYRQEKVLINSDSDFDS